MIMLLLLAAAAGAQTITHAQFRISNKKKGFRSIDLEINKSILIGINNDGRIDYIESAQGNSYTLRDMERIEIPIKFYDFSDINDLPGKIKSIGDIAITYNNVFDIHEQRGTLKSIGDIQGSDPKLVD